MDRVRRRIGDKRVPALMTAFLKSGILGEDGHLRDNDTGTPQGSILSPLLSNVALSVLDEPSKSLGWAKPVPGHVVPWNGPGHDTRGAPGSTSRAARLSVRPPPAQRRRAVGDGEDGDRSSDHGAATHDRSAGRPGMRSDHVGPQPLAACRQRPSRQESVRSRDQDHRDCPHDEQVDDDGTVELLIANRAVAISGANAAPQICEIV
jgi:hypothetical protein